jgi:hypothetical protein
VIEGEGVGNDFQHQKTDSGGETLGQMGGCFEGLECLSDRRVEDDDLHRGLEGYDGVRSRCHASKLS